MVTGVVAAIGGVMLVRMVPMARAAVRMVTAFIAVSARMLVVFDATLVVAECVLRASPVGVMMVVMADRGIRSVTAVVAGVRAWAGGRTGLRAGARSRLDDGAATGGTAGRRRGRSAARVRRRSLGIAVAA